MGVQPTDFDHTCQGYLRWNRRFEDGTSVLKAEAPLVGKPEISRLELNRLKATSADGTQASPTTTLARLPAVLGFCPNACKIGCK